MAKEMIREIESIMRDAFDDDAIVINSATTAADITAWDSMNHVRLIVAIEQDLGISMPMERVSDLQNVGELVSLVEELVG